MLRVAARFMLVSSAVVWPAVLPSAGEAVSFVNPFAEGADPWVVQYRDGYLYCQSEKNRGVALYPTDRLYAIGEKRVVWDAPDSGPHSREIWAPEIHFLDGRWYIYVAASDGENRNHRMIAVESETDDPFSPYRIKAELYTGDDVDSGANNRWAIDGTILEHDARRYMVWSGWRDERDIQYLYIAPMANPWTISGNRVQLCANDDFAWERVGESLDERGLHEAPQVIARNGRVFITYSCSGSWQPTYKLGMLTLEPGGDPMNPADWRKSPVPVFAPTSETYGSGHNCFVPSPDGSEDWFVYHAKADRRDGWRRVLFAQRLAWTDDGIPEFGMPAAWRRELVAPAGSPLSVPAGVYREDFADGLAGWVYFGHHEFYAIREERLHLGVEERVRVNDFRSGEKAIVNDRIWWDFDLAADVEVIDGERDAGLLFRVNSPSVGYDAQEGYFAGIVAGADRVVLGRTDGSTWTEIARAEVDLTSGRKYRIGVRAVGPEIVVRLDGRDVLRASDPVHQYGQIGLRVVDSHAAFDNVSVEAIKVPRER